MTKLHIAHQLRVRAYLVCLCTCFFCYFLTTKAKNSDWNLTEQFVWLSYLIAQHDQNPVFFCLWRNEGVCLCASCLNGARSAHLEPSKDSNEPPVSFRSVAILDPCSCFTNFLCLLLAGAFISQGQVGSQNISPLSEFSFCRNRHTRKIGGQFLVFLNPFRWVCHTWKRHARSFFRIGWKKDKMFRSKEGQDSSRHTTQNPPQIAS